MSEASGGEQTKKPLAKPQSSQRKKILFFNKKLCALASLRES
jgi:hypothetical protein